MHIQSLLADHPTAKLQMACYKLMLDYAMPNIHSPRAFHIPISSLKEILPRESYPDQGLIENIIYSLVRIRVALRLPDGNGEALPLLASASVQENKIVYVLPELLSAVIHDKRFPDAVAFALCRYNDPK